MALTAHQRRLIALGLATPEEFGEKSAIAAGRLPSVEQFIQYAPTPVISEQPSVEEELGLLEAFGLIPEAVSAGRRAADTEAAEIRRNLIKSGSDQAVDVDPTSKLDMGLATLGAAWDAATSDATFREALADRTMVDRAELEQALARRDAAAREAQALGERSTLLRTVGDVAGSAPESVLSMVGGIVGGAAGTAVKPGLGTVAGATAGSTLGSIPMARKAFYASWDEAFLAAKQQGLSDQDASDLADEQAFEQAATEFGVEAVTGAIPALKAGSTVLKRALATGASRVGVEAGSEGITPYAQNLVRTISAATEGDEQQRAVIGSMVEGWGSEKLREEAERGVLAGGLASTIFTAPLAPVEASAQLRQEANEQLRKDLVEQDKLRQQRELEEFAQKQREIAIAFANGKAKQADLFDGLLEEQLGGDFTPEQRAERDAEFNRQERDLLIGDNYGGGLSPQAGDRISELNRRLRDADPEALARDTARVQSEIEAIVRNAGGRGINPEEQSRIDALRASVAPRVEQPVTGPTLEEGGADQQRRIDERLARGRQDLFDRQDRLETAVETAAQVSPDLFGPSAREMVAGNIDALNRTRDQIRMTDPNAQPEQLGLALPDKEMERLAKSKELAEKQAQQKAESEKLNKQAAEKKAADTLEKDLLSFQVDFRTANPNASDAEVMEATRMWRESNSRIESFKRTNPELAKLEEEAQSVLSKMGKEQQASLKRKETNLKKQVVRDMFSSGVRDTRQIAVAMQDAVTNFRKANNLLPATQQATAPTQQTLTPATSTPAPVAPVLDEDNQAPLISMEEADRQLAELEGTARPAAKAAVSDDEVIAKIPEQFADVREKARSNNKLVRFIKDTVVPAVMLHGTTARSKLRVMRPGRGQLGTHLTTNQGVAEYFANAKAGGSDKGVMRAAVNIKNPIRMTDKGDWATDKLAQQLVSQGKITRTQAAQFVKQADAIEDRYARQYGDEVYADTPQGDKLYAQLTQELNNVGNAMLKQAGHDGVEYVNRYEVIRDGKALSVDKINSDLKKAGFGNIDTATDEQFLQVFPEADTSYIALDSNQVKDVDLNTGEFNKRKPDVRAEATNKIVFDKDNGIGATPYGMEIDYRGYTLEMPPSAFLKLATERGEQPSQGLRTKIVNGEPVAPAFLIVDFDGPVPRVVSHEGRGRMQIIRDLQGDVPVPVQIIGDNGRRARDITPEMREALLRSVISERGEVVNNPISAASPDNAAAAYTPSELVEDLGENAANLVMDVDVAQTPEQRVQALFDFLDAELAGSNNRIATEILPLLKQASALITDVTVAPTERTVTTPEGVVSKGYYDPSTGAITLGASGMNAKTVLHELLHGITWSRIRDAVAVTKDKNLAAAVAQLDEIRAEFQKWYDKNGAKEIKKDSALGRLISPRKGGLVDENGKVDADEMITYGLTDENIQKVLRSLPARGTLKTQWRKMVNVVRLAVGLEPSSMDLLDSLLEATAVVAETKVADRRQKIVDTFTDQEVGFTAEVARKRAAKAETDSTVVPDVEQFLSSGDGPVKDKLDSMLDLINEMRYVYSAAYDQWNVGGQYSALRESFTELSRRLSDEQSAMKERYGSFPALAGLIPLSPSRPAFKSAGDAYAELTQAERSKAYAEMFNKLSRAYDLDKKYETGMFGEYAASSPATKAEAVEQPLDKREFWEGMTTTSQDRVRAEEILKQTRGTGGVISRAAEAAKEAILPENGLVEPIRQFLDITQGRKMQARTEELEKLNSLRVYKDAFEDPEIAPLFQSGITKEKYDAIEAKLARKYPDAAAALASVRHSAKLDGLRLIREIYAAARRDANGNPILNSEETKRVNAIYANLDNYWTTSYQVFNPQEAELYREFLKTTPRGAEIVRAARDGINADISVFSEADLNKLKRERLERVYSAWIGDVDGRTKPEMVAALTKLFSGMSDEDKEIISGIRVQQAVEDLMGETKNVSALARYFTRNRIDLGNLQSRVEVPPYISDLLGKIEDPLVVIYNTRVAQRALLEELSMMRSLYETYKGKYFFDTEADAIKAGIKKTAIISGPTAGALNGKVTVPEIKAVFDPKEVDSTSNWWKLLTVPMSAFKMTNLVLSPAALAYNMASGVNVLLANGVGPTYGADAVRSIITTMYENPKLIVGGDLTEGTKTLLANNLADAPYAETVRREPIERAIEQLRKHGALPATTRMRQIKDAAKDTNDLVWSVYAGADMWTKLVVYYKQLDVLTAVNNTLPEEARLTDQQLKDTAAQRTKQTTFSYDLAAKFVKGGDRRGLTMFMTYQYEVYRSLTMSALRAFEDYMSANKLEKAGNTEGAAILKKHASQRLFGFAGATAGIYWQNSIVATALGGVMTVLGMGLDDEDEEKRERLEDAYREMDKFSVNKDIRAIGKLGDEFLVADVGRMTDPFGPANEMVGAMLSLDYGRFLAALNDSIASSPFIEAALKAAYGKTAIPTAIRNDQEALARYTDAKLDNTAGNTVSNLALMLMGVYKDIGVNVSNVIAGASEDYTLPEMEEDPLSARIATSAMMKVRRFDPVEAISRIDDRTLTEAKRSTSSLLIQTSTISDSRLKEEYLALREVELAVIDRYTAAVRLARDTGRTDEEIAAVLKKSNLTQAQQRYVLAPQERNFATSVLSEQTLNALETQERGEAKTREERNKIADKYDQLRRQIRAIEEKL